MRTTITKIGNSLGVIFPKDVAARLKVKKGDSLFLTALPDGYALRRYDPEFDKTIAAARNGMSRYRNALRKMVGT